MLDATLKSLLLEKKVIVSCGAGGVGKTTVSASLAVCAARLGLRVLVVTIDPSKRLAEALGVSQNAPEPVRVNVPGESLSLEAWMLDPQQISDRVVLQFSKDPDEAQKLLRNNIYKNVTAMVAGMQEYTAVEALCNFVDSDRYDLVILDTPPSRDALRFLDAPARANAFLDRRIFNLFVPGEGSFVRRMATRLIEQVMDLAFGHETRRELQQFFTLFGQLLAHLNRNQTQMQNFFRQESVGFLLVTSPLPQALLETRFFKEKTESLNLNVCGIVLNRSLALQRVLNFPRPSDVDNLNSQLDEALLARFVEAAKQEWSLALEHAELSEKIAAGHDQNVWVFPHMSDQVVDVKTLEALANRAQQVTVEAHLEGGRHD